MAGETGSTGHFSIPGANGPAGEWVSWPAPLYSRGSAFITSGPIDEPRVTGGTALAQSPLPQIQQVIPDGLHTHRLSELTTTIGRPPQAQPTPREILGSPIDWAIFLVAALLLTIGGFYALARLTLARLLSATSAPASS